MTANQINYQKYLEDVRSHKANEEAASRQAAAAESQATVAAYNAETNRMNAETNKQNALINESAVGAQWYGAQANRAYQEAMANVSQAQQLEAVRHNRANETNELLIEANKVRQQKYATDVGAETQQRNTDVTTRANITSTLITAVSNLGATALKTLPSVVSAVKSAASGISNLIN